jgi:hypothetical protein
MGNIIADHRLFPGDLAYFCHDTLLELRKKEIVAGGEKLFHYLRKGIPSWVNKKPAFSAKFYSK